MSIGQLLDRPMQPAERGFQKGISFNLADEIGGWIHGPERREAIRGRDAAAEKSHPGSFLAGEVLGELSSLLVPGAGLAGKAVSKLGPLGRVGAGAAVGGGVEGSRGFAGGQGGAHSRLGSAALPAALGAGIGGGVFAPSAQSKAARAALKPRGIIGPTAKSAPPAPAAGGAPRCLKQGRRHGT